MIGGAVEGVVAVTRSLRWSWEGVGEAWVTVMCEDCAKVLEKNKTLRVKQNPNKKTRP